MASNNISKYYKVDNGLDLTSDSQFATLSANEKIVYKPSGEKYIKNSNYSNVFDKTNTFGELETKINNKVLGLIGDANDNGIASYYNITGNKIGEFKCGLPIIGSDGKTNVTAITQNGNILTVEVPRVYYDKYGRITNWDKQVTSAVVSSGTNSGVGYTGVPVGTISMWVGSVGDIPSGWHLCDGSTGTPDLRNRFVVGAGGSYNPGNTGHVSQSMGHRSWGVGITNDNGEGGCTLYSHEDKSTGHLTYYGTLVVCGGAKSTRFNFPIPFNGEIRVPVINAVIGDDGDGIAFSRPCVFADEIEPGYIIFTNPEGDGYWRVFFVIEGSTNPDYLVSNNYGVEYYSLCYIMKTQVDGSPTVVSNNNPELLWGQTLTVGSVDGKALTVKMPEQPLYDINQGNKRPYVFESIMNWEAMATACNTTIADIMNISLSTDFRGETYTNAYGGDVGGTHVDGTEFKHGDIIIKRKITDYDEIMIVCCTDDGTKTNSAIWKSFELVWMFQSFRRFNLLKQDDRMWCVNGVSSSLTRPSEPWATPQPEDNVYPTILCEEDRNYQNCGIIDIIGIKRSSVTSSGGSGDTI